jgi:hypothetical protein
LFSTGKGSFFTAGSEFVQGCFQNIAQVPLRFNEELTGKTITGMLDNNKTGTLGVVRANSVIA